MRNDSTLRRVSRIVSDIVRCPVEDIHATAGQDSLEAWDSLAQINIIVAIEIEFGRTFSAEDVFALNSVEKIVAALENAD